MSGRIRMTMIGGKNRACTKIQLTSICSVRSRQASHRELNLAVWSLPPVFDNRHVPSLGKLIDDFAGFQASRVNWKREFLGLLNARYPV